MRKFKDISGQTFSDLTAVKHLGSDKSGNARWLFLCMCGKEVEYIAKKVLKGDALSCGCRRSRNLTTPKLCKHCGQPSTRKNRHGNMASVCHKCNNKQTNSFKTRNPKYQMVCSARARAKESGVPCTIKPSDIVIPEFCPVFGIRLDPGSRKFHDNSPSLDRIVPELGYVAGNIAVISFRANRVKGDASASELRTVADWVDSKTKIELVA